MEMRAERVDKGLMEGFDTPTGLMHGANSVTGQIKAAEPVLDRSTVTPEREIHSRSIVEEARREIRIILHAEMIKQRRLGLYEPSAVEDVIDVTPLRHPLSPVRQRLAELEEAEGEVIPG